MSGFLEGELLKLVELLGYAFLKIFLAWLNDFNAWAVPKRALASEIVMQAPTYHST
jgi:hypothetical protein